MPPTAAAHAVGYLPNIPSGNEPLASPPPGRTVNLEHPKSNSIHVYIAAGVCMPLILLFAALRAYNKTYLNRGRSLDDYTSMLATLGGLIYTSLVVALFSKGLFGNHIWDLTLGDLTNTPFLLVLVIEALWGPFIWLIKLSLFLMYMEIFKVLAWFKRLVWVGVIVSGLFYFSGTVAKLALCATRENETYIMAFSAPRCDSTKMLGIVTGIFNIISDVYLLLLPVPVVLKLRMERRKKYGILAGFGTGIIALNASVLGLYYRTMVNNNLDDTWNIMPLYLALIVEMTCGLAVLCIPSVACIAKSNQLQSCFTRIGINEGVRGKFVRMATFGGNAKAPGDQGPGHKTSDNSDTQLHTNTTSNPNVEEITSLPKI